MKISRELLQKLIKEEKAKLDEELGKKEGRPEDAAKDTKEVKPGEEADTLEKKIDFMKALDIKEAKALAALKKIREVKSRLNKGKK